MTACQSALLSVIGIGPGGRRGSHHADRGGTGVHRQLAVRAAGADAGHRRLGLALTMAATLVPTSVILAAGDRSA
jgi:hypothetical protein